MPWALSSAQQNGIFHWRQPKKKLSNDAQDSFPILWKNASKNTTLFSKKSNPWNEKQLPSGVQNKSKLYKRDYYEAKEQVQKHSVTSKSLKNHVKCGANWEP